MNKMTLGVNIAKQVFKVHYIDSTHPSTLDAAFPAPVRGLPCPSRERTTNRQPRIVSTVISPFSSDSGGQHDDRYAEARISK